MKITIHYEENIKSLMGWEEEVKTFFHFFNKAIEKGLEYKNNKVLYLSDNYFEHLISTFIVVQQYHSVRGDPLQLKHYKASFLFAIYFYVFQERRLNYMNKDIIDLINIELEILVAKKIITAKTRLQTINIGLSFINPELKFETGEHTDAELIRDIISATSPVLLKDEEDALGLLLYFSNIDEVRIITSKEHNITKELVVNNLYRISNLLVNPFVYNYYESKIDKIIEYALEGKLNVK